MTGLMSATLATAGDGKDGEDVLRKSGPRTPVASYPLPFTITAANARTNPAISTGYYFVDSDDEAPDFWRPDPSQFVDTLTEPGTWRRIVSGPRQLPNSYWSDPTQNLYGGWAFFRNPGNVNDSTNDAFAGPISIGFPFYFNGVRQDSFYVSTNGIIGLSNRRYFYEYDQFGYPTVRARLEVTPGNFSAYDPSSDDVRARTGDGMTDATADNHGFLNVACGGNTATATGGLRSGANRTLDQGSISGIWGATQPQLIAAAWDDLQVSVYNTADNAVDDFSRVYYKRSPSNDKLVIYYVNLTPVGAKTATVGGVTHNVTFNPNNRPSSGGEHYRFSLQVTLNRSDSSVVVQYERFSGIAPRSALSDRKSVV
jgi:hypothetical protein